MRRRWNWRKEDYNSTLGRDIMLEAYPGSLNWPERILRLWSLSRMPPNLIYWGSSALLNLSLVVLSKHFSIWGISPEKRDCPSKPNDHDLTAHAGIGIIMNKIPSKNFLAWAVTKIDPWKWPIQIKCINITLIRSIRDVHWGAAISSYDWVSGEVCR